MSPFAEAEAPLRRARCVVCKSDDINEFDAANYRIARGDEGLRPLYAKAVDFGHQLITRYDPVPKPVLTSLAGGRWRPEVRLRA
jgi:hypothetical protein